MSENKRFTIDRFDLLKDGEPITVEEACDLLNELFDTVVRLEKENKEYIRGLDLSRATSQSWASDVRELREENCRLEKQIEELMRENNEIKGRIINSIKKANNINCSCNPCVAEECVMGELLK